MNSVLTAMVNGAAAGILLTITVFLVLRVTPRGRLNAATRYAIWWATLALVLEMPLLFVRAPSRHPGAVMQAGAEQLPPAIRVIRAVSVAPPTSSPRRFDPLPYTRWIAAGWFSIAALLWVRLAVSWILLDRRRQRATLIRTFDLPTRKGIRLASSEEIAIPVAVGPIHPSVLIPARLWHEIGEDDRNRIVLHEAAHLSRRDDYALLLQRCIEALFALHPAVRWITRQLELEREVACDDVVLAATGEARSYAQCLTRMVELCGGVRASLAGTAAVNDRSHLASRVDRLLDKGRHTGTTLLKTRFAGAVALLALTAWVAAKTPLLVAFAAAAPSPAPISVAAAAATAEAPAPPALEESPAPALPEPQAAVQAAPLQVQIPVTVTDPQNRVVTGLERDNFRVFDDGVEQQNFRLSTQELPLSVVIVLDASGSQATWSDAERQAVTEFLGDARPSDEFALVVFRDSAAITVPFTSDPDLFQQALARVQMRGGSSLRDAMVVALREMKRARNQRRAILVISDGTDNSSRISATEWKEALEEGDCQYFAIHVGDTVNPRGFAGLRESSDLINEFDRAGKVAAGLRNLYVLTYAPVSAGRDGNYHRVQVQLVTPAGLPPLKAAYRMAYRAQ